MHYHTSCSHDLKFCAHCNIVYCIKCKQEWKQGLSTYGGGCFGGGTYPNNLMYPNPSITYCAAKDGGSVGVSGTHTHE